MISNLFLLAHFIVLTFVMLLVVVNKINNNRSENFWVKNDLINKTCHEWKLNF